MRRLVTSFVVAAVLAAMPSMGTSAMSAPPVQAPDPGASFAERVARQVIVVYRTGTTTSDRATARAGAKAAKTRTLGRPRFELVTPTVGRTVAQTVADLRRAPGVVAAVPDSVLEVQSIPDDPLFGQLWGLLNTGQLVEDIGGGLPGADIDAALAWDRTIGSPSAVVADIDSGYRFDHPDLAPVAWHNPGEVAANGMDDDGNGYVDDTRGWDALDGDNDPTDPGYFDDPFGRTYFDSHGVHTAGTIGAKGDNGVGLTGVAQNARIMPVRVCIERFCSTSAIVEGINYAGGNGAKVANISLTGYAGADATGQLPTALALAANPGTLYVAAAGNDGFDVDAAGPRSFPCSINPARSDASMGYHAAKRAVDNVLCVAATDRTDQLAGFSNRGTTSVDLAAPGTQTLSTGFAFDEAVWESDLGTEAGFAAWTTPSPPATDPDEGFIQIGFEDFVFSRLWSDPPVDFDLPRTHAPGTTRATQSPQITIGAEYQACTFEYLVGGIEAGDDGFAWGVAVDGQTVFDQALPVTLDGTNVSQEVALPASTEPRSVTVQFRFTRGQNGAEDAFVSVVDVAVGCTRATYWYASGTSMATPHVSGVAALLFSLKPNATVSQIRQALLKGVDTLPALALTTVAGGRLNAWKALDALLPLDTRITGGPSGKVKSSSATFTFDTNNTGGATGFECGLDTGPLVPCTTPVTYTGLKAGKHTFRVRSVLPGGVDSSPATREWSVTGN